MNSSRIPHPPAFVQHDGGRSDAGYKGKTGDCVVRAIAIATGLSYKAVYDELTYRQKHYGQTRRNKAARQIKQSGHSVRGAYTNVSIDRIWKNSAGGGLP